jgi:hypothetical protein
VLQCVAVCCSVVHGVAVRCIALQCDAVCCSVYIDQLDEIPWLIATCELRVCVICACARVHIRVRACMYLFACVCMHMCVHVHVCGWVCACVCVLMCACMHVCIRSIMVLVSRTPNSKPKPTKSKSNNPR